MTQTDNEQSQKTSARQLLEGIRVLDLTTMVAGPLATMILGDQGADVIKVEAPGNGDLMRQFTPEVGLISTAFLNNNRNKRSIVLDLKSNTGRKAFLRLTETADVVVQNFRPGVVDRLGIGEAVIRNRNHNVIYVSISGFGESGPYSSMPTYDPIMQAFVGVASIQGGGDDQRPRLVRTLLADKVTALVAAQAISSALFHRAQTGMGQHIRLSMLDAVLMFLWSSDMSAQTHVLPTRKRQPASSFLDLIYETIDGYIAVAIMSDAQWRSFARAVEQPRLLDDPRFETTAMRDRNIDARLAAMQAALAQRTTAEWLHRLQSQQVPCAPVNSRNDLLDHPQLMALGSIVEFDHPHSGRIRQARHAARFSDTPAKIRRGAPLLGQHTDEVLAELGLCDLESGVGQAVKTDRHDRSDG